MKSSAWLQGSFAEHTEYICQHFGPAAAEVRHELFYLHAGRSQTVAGIRGCGALLRDAWRLLRQSGTARKTLGQRQAILLTTLAGTSGWGTLQRVVPALLSIGYEPFVLLHPRLANRDINTGQPIIRPMRPERHTWCAALLVFIAALRQRQPLLLASCLARRTLWAGSLQRTLATSRGVLLLHNDFDLMSRAAIDQGLTTICMQHGIPTDEFFPTQADWYVVWGEASRQVFDANGTSDTRLVMDALGRGEISETPACAPEGMALLSQTHAQVLGEGIGEALNSFANALLRIAPGARILLHPQEGQPYTGTAARAVCRPPHPELQSPTTRTRLVVGYCSTAMLDAALAGHWVVALQLSLPGNLAIRKALAAPLQAATAEHVVEIYQRLRDDPAFRRDRAQAQAHWLRGHFANGNHQFDALLRRLQQSPSMECPA